MKLSTATTSELAGALANVLECVDAAGTAFEACKTSDNPVLKAACEKLIQLAIEEKKVIAQEINRRLTSPQPTAFVDETSTISDLYLP